MTKTKLSDGCLISLYKKGNEEAFSYLVEKYTPKVYTSIYLIVKDKYHFLSKSSDNRIFSLNIETF